MAGRGVTIREMALGAAPIEPLNISTIAIVGTAPDAAVEELKIAGLKDVDRVFTNPDGSIKYNEPILITKRSEARIGERGTLPLHLDAIYAQGNAIVAMVIVPKTDDVSFQPEITSLGTTLIANSYPAATAIATRMVNNASQPAISGVGLGVELVASADQLGSEGDYTIIPTGGPGGNYYIKFQNLSNADQANLTASLSAVNPGEKGRKFTVGTDADAPVYEIIGTYDTTDKQIPVRLVSGNPIVRDFPHAIDLFLEEQVIQDGLRNPLDIFITTAGDKIYFNPANPFLENIRGSAISRVFSVGATPTTYAVTADGYDLEENSIAVNRTAGANPSVGVISMSVAAQSAGTLSSAAHYAVREVGGQLSIEFPSAISSQNRDNVAESVPGRRFTLGSGTAQTVYEVVGRYIPATRRIPVRLVGGDGPYPPGTVTLSLAQQAEKVGQREDRTNATGSLEERTGVYAFLDAESVVGRRPRLIAAPGLDTGSRPGNAKNPLASALEIVAHRLRGIAYIDGPNTTHAAALEYAEDFNTDRTNILDPGAMVTDGEGNLVDVALSAFAVGLTSKVDSREGWWNPASNRPLLGIQKLKRPIDYSSGDASSRAVILNRNGIVTVIREQGGFNLFGVRTSMVNSPFQFTSVRRIADNVEDSTQRAMFYYVDRNINKNFLRAVTNRANGFIRNMIAQGALIGGEVFPDGELNTKDSIAQGKVYFNARITPPYPAEEIIFTFNFVNDYLTTITL